MADNIFKIIKQDSTAQRSIFQTGIKPCMVLVDMGRGAKMWCEKWAYEVLRVSLLLNIFFSEKQNQNKHEAKTKQQETQQQQQQPKPKQIKNKTKTYTG